MNEASGKNVARGLTREERLAIKLRENLRRRKAQARGASESRGHEATQTLPKGPHES